MDYFQGVMFFTTNRPLVIDEAIHSRITLNIAYPDFDTKTRELIWTEKFKSAGIQISGDINELVKIDINGREIRNVVRLTKIILGKKVSQEQIIELIMRTNIKGLLVNK